MKNFRLDNGYRIFFQITMLFFSFQIQAIERDEAYISDVELREILEDSGMKYVYLGKDFSNLCDVIAVISKLDDNEDSILYELNKHLEEGFSVGVYDFVIEALGYAENVLQKNYATMSSEEAQNLSQSLDEVVSQVVNDHLTVDSQKIIAALDLPSTLGDPAVIDDPKMLRHCFATSSDHCCPVRRCKLIKIREKVEFLNKVKFKEDVKFKDEVEFEDDVEFEEDVTIEGTLTVTDLVVLSCIDNLCVNELTVIDIIVPGGSCLDHLCVNNLTVSDIVVLSCVDNLCVNNLSVTDLVVASCMDNLCVNNLSVTDLAVASCIDNLCVNNLTVTDLVVTDLSVIGCLANLCVNNLSAVDESVSGTLSVNDLVVNNCMNNLCVIDFSAVDASISGTLSANNAVINHLSVNDIVVASCLDELCVINLSAVDASIDSLSVNDLVVNNCMDNLCVINFSAVDASIDNLSVGDISGGTISACDVIVGCNILMNNSISPTVGNVLKAGNRFIHNFGTDNTFVGINAGNFTMGGAENVGVGRQALSSNTTGFENVAVGGFALPANTIGANDVAVGAFALTSNTTGNDNTALGGFALAANTTGSGNVAVGFDAGFSLATGNNNVFVGNNAGALTTSGATNVIIGFNAGVSLVTGSDNIYISSPGVAAESGIIRIGTTATHTSAFMQGVFTSVVGGTGIPVYVDAAGQLGTVVSSKRFKHNIEDMDSVDSSNIYKLRPVTFVYNSDETDTKQYGLIAEEVDQIFPALVVRDEDDAPYTVRYHLLPMLLLNEVQKLHGVIQDQTTVIDELKSDSKKFGAMLKGIVEAMNTAALNLQ